MQNFKAGAVLLLSLLFLWACSEQGRVAKISGHAMGTSWHVTVVDTLRSDAELIALVNAELAKVDERMSTYRPDSELSRFNASGGESFRVSADTLAVTLAALEIAAQTDGAFNPAVGPLVNLWGFGPETTQGAPSPAAIELAIAQTDLKRLMVDSEASTLAKSAAISLDYSAIAKGYAVDKIVTALGQAGEVNYLVEVGGEVRTLGKNPSGRPWRIGIEAPSLNRGEVAAAINVSGYAVATSGDYRNYREIDGQRVSHTIDPKTGVPVRHKLASVTIVADSAMLADAYATALAVMGPERGLAFAQATGLAAYLIVKEEDGFGVKYSQAFEPFLE